MKRNFILIFTVAAITGAAGWNVSRIMSEKTPLSDMALANVEALAQESGGSGGCKWKSLKCSKGSGFYEGCLSNGDGNSCSCGSISRNC